MSCNILNAMVLQDCSLTELDLPQKYATHMDEMWLQTGLYDWVYFAVFYIKK